MLFFYAGEMLIVLGILTVISGTPALCRTNNFPVLFHIIAHKFLTGTLILLTGIFIEEGVNPLGSGALLSAALILLLALYIFRALGEAADISVPSEKGNAEKKK